jgi:hypothetical protein
MTFYELKNNIINKGRETHFFDHDTLKFFGESLSRMRLLKTKQVVTDILGKKHTCYVIAATRTKTLFVHANHILIIITLMLIHLSILHVKNKKQRRKNNEG